MPNYLDFLVVFDEHIRRSSLGFVIYGHELMSISEQAGLSSAGDQTAARWAGELANDGYISHSKPGLGDHRPIPPGAYLPEDLSRFSDWRITPAGRAEADRVRRQHREDLSSATVTEVPDLLTFIDEEQHRAAITTSFLALRNSLDAGGHAAAIGAAKELIETACKILILDAGHEQAARMDLPALYRRAVAAAGRDAISTDLGRSLATVVQRLAEARNASGVGHGQAVPPEVTARDARLAAGAACAVTFYLLGPSK